MTMIATALGRSNERIISQPLKILPNQKVCRLPSFHYYKEATILRPQPCPNAIDKDPKKTLEEKEEAGS